MSTSSAKVPSRAALPLKRLPAPSIAAKAASPGQDLPPPGHRSAGGAKLLKWPAARLRVKLRKSAKVRSSPYV